MSNVISVSQFNNYVHNIFVSEEILQNIAIYGEVSAASMSGGNLYFSIKDEGAVLNCVRFGAAGGFVPREGDQVMVVGSPNYYVKGGRFSFNVVRIEPYGQGLLYKQFMEMKNKLEALGMFDQKNKKPLPEVIRRVGVVSSETGAVIQDIIDITGRRNPMLDIVLYPAKVQGIGAEITIIDGLRALDKTDVDVIIIARGGGSAEDLSTFNDEKLAYAIFETEKPVISAVGHETDFTIADFVADLRAPTPSAAAELVAVNIADLRKDLHDYSKRLLYLTTAFYNMSRAKVDNAIGEISHLAILTIQDNYLDVSTLLNGLKSATQNALQQKCYSFDILTSKLENVNPIKIMRMGYSQTIKNGAVVSSVGQVDVNDEIDVRLSDGDLQCIVKNKREGKK